MRVWLDDVRPAPEGWVWAKTYLEAKRLLETGLVTHLSLDHDLGQGSDGKPDLTGYDLCRWMRDANEWPTECIAIHSWNPVGAKRMRDLIQEVRPHLLLPSASSS